MRSHRGTSGDERGPIWRDRDSVSFKTVAFAIGTANPLSPALALNWRLTLISNG